MTDDTPPLPPNLAGLVGSVGEEPAEPETETDRAYPLPRPADDPRFSFGLTFDVARVLEQHGYPEIREGMDLLRLQEALFRFIYAD